MNNRGTKWTRIVGALTLALLALAGVLSALGSASAQTPSTLQTPPLALPNGVAAGDVTQTSAVLWTRAASAGSVTFAYRSDLSSAAIVTSTLVVDPLQPVVVRLSGLTPGTRYVYTATVNAATAGTAASTSVSGRFRTLAMDGEHRGLRFGVGGDWRGNLAPFPAVANAPSRDLDFFLALGDTIAADEASPAVPVSLAETLWQLQLKHDEVYSTRYGLNTLAALRASTALFVTLDDHEVINNFAGANDAVNDGRFYEEWGLINDSILYENGLRALHDYNPLHVERYGATGDVRTADEYRLYRYRTFGSDAALFVLDGRSFRDAQVTEFNGDPTDLTRFFNDAFAPQRTLLGAAQIAELKRDLLDAKARGVLWKFIAVPEPIQNLGLASAHDRFEGYAAERAHLLHFITEHEIDNVVFVAADIHGALVNNLTYQTAPFGEQLPTTAFEVTTPPVASSTLGAATMRTARRFDLLSAEDEALYNTLPVAPDADADPDDRDDFLRGFLDGSLALLGYSTVGLDDANLDVDLLTGDYMSIHQFGWTEFEIAPATGTLTVTTYGIPAYTPAEIAGDPASITARVPAVANRFVVQPRGASTLTTAVPTAVPTDSSAVTPVAPPASTFTAAPTAVTPVVTPLASPTVSPAVSPVAPTVGPAATHTHTPEPTRVSRSTELLPLIFQQ